MRVDTMAELQPGQPKLNDPGTLPEDGRLDSIRNLVTELRVQYFHLEKETSELRGTNSQLRMTCDRFARFFQYAPVGLVILDPTGRILDLNREAGRLLGSDRLTFSGRKFESLVAQPDRQTFVGSFEQCMSHRRPRSCRVRLQAFGANPMLAQLQSVAVRDPDWQTQLCHVAITRCEESEPGADPPGLGAQQSGA